MADESTTTNEPAPTAPGATSTPAATGGAPNGDSPLTGVRPGPSLVNTPAPTGDKAPPATAPTAEQIAANQAAAAESAARVDAFGKAEGKEAKLAAYNALNDAEKQDAFKAMPAELRKELGVTDPSRPTYTDFKLPEGLVIDPEAMKVAGDMFADAGLSQEQAQKFIDLAVSREQAAAQRSVQAFVDMQNKWVREVKDDPEIGGDKLAATLASGARAIDRLGIPGLKEALDYTGAGNNPAIVKAFARIGQMMAEDRLVPANGGPPNAPRSPAEVIYGGAPKQSADA